jgi:hypothetical protein
MLDATAEMKQKTNPTKNDGVRQQFEAPYPRRSVAYFAPALIVSTRLPFVTVTVRQCVEKGRKACPTNLHSRRQPESI